MPLRDLRFAISRRGRDLKFGSLHVLDDAGFFHFVLVCRKTMSLFDY